MHHQYHPHQDVNLTFDLCPLARFAKLVRSFHDRLASCDTGYSFKQVVWWIADTPLIQLIVSGLTEGIRIATG
jgi:hypothetical protein